jgi:hypothetical protein
MEDDFFTRQGILQQPFQATRFLCTDDDIAVNENNIVWVKRIRNCMHICTNTNGCIVKKNTHPVCQDFQPESFARLENLFSTNQKKP